MPLTAIVLSKDRPAQLDLLLRSVTCNADDLIDDIHVLWCASGDEFSVGYRYCSDDHPSVNFHSETHFPINVEELVDQADEYVMFLTDDGYFYREQQDIDPCAVLHGEPNVLCFSLRLGENSNYCYPLKGRNQRLPNFEDGGGYLVWEWETADADFGYPGSVDGHIFRKKHLLQMINGNENWWNPNTLEDALCRTVYMRPEKLMASFNRSVFVNIPVNRTSSSHPGNRFGEQHLSDQYFLNSEFLEGRRIQFPDVHPDTVTAAHQEMYLEIQ